MDPKPQQFYYIFKK